MPESLAPNSRNASPVLNPKPLASIIPVRIPRHLCLLPNPLDCGFPGERCIRGTDEPLVFRPDRRVLA
jgi:hypothetical protein